MSDNEKFEGLKKVMIDENEKKYGDEIRKKYGNETVNKSNEKFMNMTIEDKEKLDKLRTELDESLVNALKNGDPQSDISQKTCALHKEWLMFYWSDYSKEAHLNLGQMYVSDPRFKKYYDDIAIGSAEFLYESLKYFCKH